MNNEMHQFLNRLRSLWNIDGYLLADVLSLQQQQDFVRDPVRYFTQSDRKTAEAIWREIERRQK